MIPVFRRPLLTASLILWASTASAATAGGQVTVQVNELNFQKLSKFDCENNGSTVINFNYTYPFVSGQIVEYYLAPDSTCAAPQGGTINSGSTQSTNSALIQTLNPRPTPSNTATGLSYSDNTTQLTFGGIWNWYATYKNNANGSTAITYKSTPDSANCIDEVNNITAYLCVLIASPDATATGGFIFPAGFIGISLQSVPPDAPNTPTVTPLDSAINVSWDAVTTPIQATRYDVHVQDAATKQDVKVVQVTGGQITARIDGLTNGTNYDVFVVALDDGGSNPPTTSNQSDPSPTVTASPIPSISYFEEYRRNGGQELGGCSSTGATGLLVFLPLLLFVRRRRRPGATLAVTLLLLGAAAEAQTPTQEDLSTPIVRQPSPEWFRVELQTGPFTPNPDQGLSTPTYSLFFPTKNQLLTRLSFHVNFFGLFGHASAGVALGYWQANGHALQEDHVTPAGDTETFTLYPITPMLTYRADFLYSKWKIPIVPYGKVGYGFTYFSDQKNGKTTSGVDSATGKKWRSYGWAGGLEWAAGVEIPLDFFDQRRASNLDADFGINSTGLFAEYAQMQWKGFNGGLPLNGSSWSGGVYLAF